MAGRIDLAVRKDDIALVHVDPELLGMRRPRLIRAPAAENPLQRIRTPRVVPHAGVAGLVQVGCHV